MSLHHHHKLDAFMDSCGNCICNQEILYGGCRVALQLLVSVINDSSGFSVWQDVLLWILFLYSSILFGNSFADKRKKKSNFPSICYVIVCMWIFYTIFILSSFLYTGGTRYDDFRIQLHFQVLFSCSSRALLIQLHARKKKNPNCGWSEVLLNYSNLLRQFSSIAFVAMCNSIPFAWE